MSIDQNTSPKVEASDAQSEQPIAQRPKQVLYAVVLLCVSLVLHIPSTINGYQAAATNSIIASYIGFMLAMYALAIWVIIYLARGRNWARYVLLVLTVLAFRDFPELYQKFPASQFALRVADQVISVIALWLVFTRPGALWFRRKQGKKEGRPRTNTLQIAAYFLIAHYLLITTIEFLAKEGPDFASVAITLGLIIGSVAALFKPTKRGWLSIVAYALYVLYPALSDALRLAISPEMTFSAYIFGMSLLALVHMPLVVALALVFKPTSFALFKSPPPGNVVKEVTNPSS